MITDISGNTALFSKKTPPRVESVWKKDESRPCFVGEENVFQEWYCFNGYHPSNPKLDTPQPLPFLPSFNIKNHLGNLLAPIGVNVLIGTLPRNRKPSKKRKPSISRKLPAIVTPQAITEYHINFFKIIYHYQPIGKSDYRISYNFYRNNSLQNTTPMDAVEIEKVKRNEIGTYLTTWKKIVNTHSAEGGIFNSPNSYLLIGVTFEYDKDRSYNSVNTHPVWIPNLPNVFYCEMHDPTDWYQRIAIEISLISAPGLSWTVYDQGGYVNILRTM